MIAQRFLPSAKVRWSDYHSRSFGQSLLTCMHGFGRFDNAFVSLLETQFINQIENCAAVRVFREQFNRVVNQLSCCGQKWSRYRVSLIFRKNMASVGFYYLSNLWSWCLKWEVERLFLARSHVKKSRNLSNKFVRSFI